MAPIVRGVDGSCREPGEEESGLPLAIAEDLEYEAVTVSIAPGETVVLYTDGVNEAMNAAGDLFSIERVRELACEGGTPKEVSDRIIAALKEFTGVKAQDDDICVVVIGRDPL